MIETTEFERGVRAGIEAFEGYFRNEDDNLTIEERVESDDGGSDYVLRSITEADCESYREGAREDALLNERARLDREASNPVDVAQRAGLAYVDAVIEVAVRMRAGNADIHGGLSAEIAAEEEFKLSLAQIAKADGGDAA